MRDNINNYKYSILTYNVNNYEIVDEIENKKPHVEYVLVTDNPNLTSETWTIKYVYNHHPEDPFDLCYKIRFNPFDYVSCDIVMRIDGSMKIVGDTDFLIDEFNKGNYDASVMIHPGRNNLLDEYQTWVNVRAYNPQHANKILKFVAQVYNYDAKEYKGLYQYNFMIQKNNKFNNLWNQLTLTTLKYLAENGKQVERLDQTIGSMILNKYYSDSVNILPVTEDICNGNPFLWCSHGTDRPMKTSTKEERIEPYLFNKICTKIFPNDD